MMRLGPTIRLLMLASTATLGLADLGCVTMSREGRVESDVRGSEPDLAGWAVALVDAHNQERVAHHLEVLHVSGPLEASARAHARDMARRRWMSHRGSDGSSPFKRITAEGYAFRRAGENIAAGHSSVAAVMSGWMHSPGHRRNVLGRFSEIGAACATASDGTPYWCVTFGDPEGP